MGCYYRIISFHNMIRQLLKINKEERFPLIGFFLWQLILQIAVVVRYDPIFSVLSKNPRKLLINNFCISGFDPLTYDVVTEWNTAYNVYRHPLLAFFYYPIYKINQGLIFLTGKNFCVILVAIVLLIISCYAFLFLFRICKQLIGINLKESTIIALMLFSFAHILLAAISPDHFIISLCLILAVIYITGIHIKRGQTLSRTKTVILFVLTAGISLNNGIKIFLASLFNRGKRFFLPLHLLLVIIIPSFLMWHFCLWEDNTFMGESHKAKRIQKVKIARAKKDMMFHAFKDTTKIKDSMQQVIAFNKVYKAKLKQEQANKIIPGHGGKPIKSSSFYAWTDVTTSRTTSIVENLFGESIQLHQQHTLGDVMRDRPLFVHYNWVLNYIIEAIIILLFGFGLWAGRYYRLMWMSFSFFAMDMVLHLGIGFAINEVYIMAAQWIYVIPIALAYLISSMKGKRRKYATKLLAIITAYLIIYNTTLTLNAL